MSISLDCSTCGKRYELAASMASRRVKCPCGHVMIVPDASDEAEFLPQDDWIDAAFGPPAAMGRKSAADPCEPEISGALTPDGNGIPREHAPIPPAADALLEIQLPPKPEPSAMRTLVGIGAILYGSYVTVRGVLFLTAFSWVGLLILSFTHALLMPFLGAVIALGGVMILKRKPHAPGYTGMFCVLLCFLPLFSVVRWSLAFFVLGEFVALLLLLLGAAAELGVPILITIWCLKEEMAAEQNAGERE
ncbi:MAG: hypothetical protein ACYTG0_39075 [Planctomycetota bacterium]